MTIQENRVQGRLFKKSTDEPVNPKIYEADNDSVCLVKLAEFYLSKLGKTHLCIFFQYIVRV